MTNLRTIQKVNSQNVTTIWIILLVESNELHCLEIPESKKSSLPLKDGCHGQMLPKHVTLSNHD